MDGSSERYLRQRQLRPGAFNESEIKCDNDNELSNAINALKEWKTRSGVKFQDVVGWNGPPVICWDMHQPLISGPDIGVKYGFEMARALDNGEFQPPTVDDEMHGKFVKYGGIYVRLDKNKPLWWIPAHVSWTRYDYFQHIHNTLWWLLGAAQLVQQQMHGELVLPQYVFGSVADGKELKAYERRHELFLLHDDEVGWGLWIGIKEDSGQQTNENDEIVPANVTIGFMDGEIRDEQNDDMYQFGLFKGNDQCHIVTTADHGENQPLIGGVAYFANHSCSENRLLNGFEMHPTVIYGNQIGPKSQFGLSVRLQTKRALTRRDFTHESEMKRLNIVFNEQNWLLLPLETNYNTEISGPDTVASVTCRCKTRCWRLEENDASKITIPMRQSAANLHQNGEIPPA